MAAASPVASTFTQKSLAARAVAVPLATILARFRFRGAALIHTLGVVPLVMPPFVGAVAMQLIYGRNGSINLLLMDWFGFRIPFMDVFVLPQNWVPLVTVLWLLGLTNAINLIDGLDGLAAGIVAIAALAFYIYSRRLDHLDLLGPQNLGPLVAVIAAGVCVAVDFEYRAVPAFQQLQALLASNPVGIPWLVKLDWLMGSRADASRPWNWYSQRAAGGGVLGSLGTHAFDTLHWLLGPTRSLTASRSLAIPHRPLADGLLEVMQDVLSGSKPVWSQQGPQQQDESPAGCC